MARSSSKILLETLVQLNEETLQRFKEELSEIRLQEGYRHIPLAQLPDADPPALVDLLLSSYGKHNGMKVAAQALRAVSQEDLAERLIPPAASEASRAGGWRNLLCCCSSGKGEAPCSCLRNSRLSCYHDLPTESDLSTSQSSDGRGSPCPETTEETTNFRSLKLVTSEHTKKAVGASSRAQEPSTSPSPGATGEHFEEEMCYVLEEIKLSIRQPLVLVDDWIDFKNTRQCLIMDEVFEMPILEPESHIVTYDKISAEELASASDLTNIEIESNLSSEDGSIICQQTHLVSTGSAEGAAGETSRSQNPTACLRGQDKCGWCAREEEDLPEEVKPESIQDPEGKQETYRVHFSQPGWFRCSETELEFEVRAAVTVQYGYGSWDQHLTESQQQEWMVAGPLFDIRVEPAEAVAAVHLPHFLCLREADSSWVQIAHFLEEGMTLQSPTRVRPFHAVLQNPRFSRIGVIWKKIKTMKKKSLIHSLVLLYQAQKRVNLTLHLYLIPSDGSRIKAVKDYEKEFQSWCVSKSHFTSRPLCFGTSCVVSSPSEITVKPKELPFLDKPANALQPFTEIHTKDVKELELNLVEKNDETPIWEAVVRPEDLMSSDSSTKMQTDTHFVDRHREQLIQRVTAVDGILDLLYGPILDTEQYQSVRAEKTNAAKMRKLYELAPSWNTHCKEQFYQALREKHRHLVEELEGR